MIPRIIQRAIENIIKIFGSKKEFGKQVGETITSLAVISPVTYFFLGKDRKILLTEVQRIYLNKNGELNTREQGHIVAIVYQGSDNIYYKHANDRWFKWNGNDWA